MGRRAPKPIRPSLNPSAWAPTSAYPSIDWRQPLKRNCVRCGIAFLVTGPNVRACLDCRPKHKKERRGKYYRNVVCADGRKKENKRQNEARARRCPPKMKVCAPRRRRRYTGKEKVREGCVRAGATGEENIVIGGCVGDTGRARMSLRPGGAEEKNS
jgi:hypothetical protein